MPHTRALAPRPVLLAAALVAACSGGNTTTETDASATDTTTTTDGTDATSLMTTTLTTTTLTTTTDSTTGPTTTMTTGPTTSDTEPTTTMTTSPTTSETDSTTTQGTTTEGTTTEGTTTEGTTEPPANCDDLVLNGDETDVDCGGSCLPCADGLACLDGPDCESKVCTDLVCAAPTCDDSVQNAIETDVDCGGGECGACISGQMCVEGSDCKSTICDAMICIDSTCEDNKQNGAETDVDCGGGECPGCADGLACSVAEDCESGVCTDKSCAMPACDDMVQNGSELGVDCGGDCMPCPLPILNEVDYDMIGADNAEFIEIYNPNMAPVNLKGLEVLLVNGADSKVYRTVDLSPGDVLMPMSYLVIVPPNFPALPPGVIRIEYGATDQVQNGPADGIALVNSSAKLLIDALSYEGAVTMAMLPFDTVSLVEGTLLPANVADSNTLPGSLARLPNGVDTDDAATDWNITATATPGLANL